MESEHKRTISSDRARDLAVETDRRRRRRTHGWRAISGALGALGSFALVPLMFNAFGWIGGVVFGGLWLIGGLALVSRSFDGARRFLWASRR